MVSKPAIKNNKNDMYMININFKSLRNTILYIKCLNFYIFYVEKIFFNEIF